MAGQRLKSMSGKEKLRQHLIRFCVHQLPDRQSSIMTKCSLSSSFEISLYTNQSNSCCDFFTESRFYPRITQKILHLQSAAKSKMVQKFSGHVYRHLGTLPIVTLLNSIVCSLRNLRKMAIYVKQNSSTFSSPTARWILDV